MSAIINGGRHTQLFVPLIQQNTLLHKTRVSATWFYTGSISDNTTTDPDLQTLQGSALCSALTQYTQ